MQLGGKKMWKISRLEALAVAAGALVAGGLLVLMMVLVEAQPAEATFPGQNGRIAYHSLTKTDYEIFTIKPTGGKSFNVTKNTTGGQWPSYSPDGQTIAFAWSDPLPN